MIFSVLIANYNNGHFFKECYDSILKQSYSNLEIIIVDDASTDNSIEIITEIIKNDTRCKIYKNNKNEGCGYTKNKCVSLATAEICGFLDPDDTLEPNAIEEMIRAHTEYINASIITSKYYNVDLSLNKIEVSTHGEPIPQGESYLTYGRGALTHFATFKREKYLLTEGINPNLKRAVDQDLYLKLEEVGSTHFIDLPLYNYRINKNSISANENLYKARYWHFTTIVDAYKRRIKKNDPNLTKKGLKRIQYNYYKERMKLEVKNKKICNKYYFLFKLTSIKPFKNMSYKITCLIIPSYA